MGGYSEGETNPHPGAVALRRRLEHDGSLGAPPAHPAIHQYFLLPFLVAGGQLPGAHINEDWGIVQAVDPANNGSVSHSPIPVDLVTASASGLDPHISPANAALQVSRVARARGLPEDAIRRLVVEHTEGRQLGFMGQPRVSVLDLNLALDQTSARHAP